MSVPTNILHQLDQIPENVGDGIVRRIHIPFAALNLQSSVAIAADETNAIVVKCEDDIDTLFIQELPIPLDYDEAADHLKLIVVASQLTVSTDDDVQLDTKLYKKVPGSALGSDLNPTAPGTVLTTTETEIEFDFSGNGLTVGDIMHIHLITNGNNDTDGEEVLLHKVEIEYKGMLVASNLTDRT